MIATVAFKTNDLIIEAGCKHVPASHIAFFLRDSPVKWVRIRKSSE